MPAINAQNFEVGNANLYVNDTFVGGTTGDGVVITYTPDVHEHQAGQHGTTPIAVTLIGERVEIEVTMGESTLENLNRAMAGSSLAGDRLSLGSTPGAKLTGVKLTIEPVGTPNNDYAWVFTNCVTISPVEVAYQTESERVVNVTFLALVDTTAEAGEVLGYAE